MVKTAARHGYLKLSVAKVIESAGVSRRTFYDLYGDKHQCFVAVLEETVEKLVEYVAAAVDRDGATAHERVAGLARGLLDFWLDEPAMARTCIVESVAAGPQGIAQRARMVERLGTLLGDPLEDGADDNHIAALTLVGVAHELILSPPSRQTVVAVADLMTDRIPHSLAPG